MVCASHASLDVRLDTDGLHGDDSKHRGTVDVNKTELNYNTNSSHTNIILNGVSGVHRQRLHITRHAAEFMCNTPEIRLLQIILLCIWQKLSAADTNHSSQRVI